MDIKTFVIDGVEVQFVNESVGTRNGFKHVSHCFVNNTEIGDNTTHYLNRTWECYQFQTCMRGLVNKLIEKREEFLKDKFKFENDYKVLTSKRQEEFDKVLKADNKMVFYEKLKNEIGF